jgi:hypothetical protein
MTPDRPIAVVGVFTDPVDAQHAITELQHAGFPDDQIGVAARHVAEPMTTGVRDLRHDDSTNNPNNYALQGAATGVAAGAGLGTLAGLAILAGLLPPIGPAIAGGTLAVVLSTAAAGAAAVGLAGALAGLGVSHEAASFYESEFQAGRVVVAVTAPGRDAEAMQIIKRFNGYDMSDQFSMAQDASQPPSVAMPMEPGVPANVNLAGEAISPVASRNVEVPVRSEDLVGEEAPSARRSTIRVPVPSEDVKLRSAHPNQ